jgi:hypothetical protein
MYFKEQLDLETMERASKQCALLLRLYQMEFAKDPSSRATGSSRSNLLALRHTMTQIYGEVSEVEPS